MLLSLLAVSAGAQLPRMTETVEVRVVSFDVVVTDRDGTHVYGLTKDDFELFENGKRQEITNLSEFTAAAHSEGAPEPAPARSIVIFFDVLSTSTSERRRASDAITAFLKEVRSEDQAMLVTYNRGLNIVVPPTSDRDKLMAGLSVALLAASFGTASSLLNDQQFASTSAEERTIARINQKVALHDFKSSAHAVNTILTRLSDVEGRKILILFTKGFDFVEPAQEASEAGEIMESIAKHANVAGVTLYGVFGGGLDSGMSAADTSPGMADVRARSASRSVDGLRYLAARTGGLVASNTNYFHGAMKSIASDLANYYSLGYRVTTRRVDAERAVTIKTRDKRYTARARRSFVERSVESVVADRLASNLFFPTSSNDLQITAAPGTSTRRRRNRYAVTVDIRIPYASLMFSPDGSGFAADLSVYIGTADEKGGTSAVKKFDHRITVSREKLAKIGGKHYTYGFDIDLRTIPGNHRIAVAVVDQSSKVTGFAAVELPGL